MARGRVRLSPAQFKEYARIGAALRYQRLGEEVRAIERAFPGLSSPKKSQALHVAGSSRRAYRMSDAARKAVSERMTKYWANRRKAAAKTKSAK